MSPFATPRNLIARLGAIAMIVMLASCAATRPAPVSDARPTTAGNAETPAAPKSTEVAAAATDSARLHVVQRSETLYSIALQYGLDYRELAAWNNIVNPAVIRVGDMLRVNAPGAPDATSPVATTTPLPQPGVPVATPLVFTSGAAPVPEGSPLANSAQMKVEPKAGRVPYSDAAYAKMLAEASAAAVGATIPTTPDAITPAAPPAAAGNDNIAWAWPVKGKVLSTFTETSKGIDIAGTRGAAVFAAAPGKVIYNQSGLRGYGRLVIIKHNDTWLSAYAHNEKVLVNEGQEIKKGQKIAEMGSSDTDVVKLHFEIRSKGKPVDPLKFLPAQ